MESRAVFCRLVDKSDPYIFSLILQAHYSPKLPELADPKAHLAVTFEVRIITNNYYI